MWLKSKNSCEETWNSDIPEHGEFLAKIPLKKQGLR